MKWGWPSRRRLQQQQQLAAVQRAARETQLSLLRYLSVPPAARPAPESPEGADPHRTLWQDSWWLLAGSKLQIHLHEAEPARCQETDKAYAKSQPSEGIKQLLEEKQWLNKVQQMMPINKFSITKGHPGSQKEAAKSCNHATLQYPLQKVQKHIIYFVWKRTRRTDYLRKLQPATKTSLSAFYLREWGCISDPISYFRWIISLNHTAVICLHLFFFDTIISSCPWPHLRLTSSGDC